MPDHEPLLFLRRTARTYRYTQVVAAPDVEIVHVKAAQEFKELSDKVANARGDSRGKRSPKGQTATAAARRAGRGGVRGRSKLSPLPSSDGGGRRSATPPPVGNNGGGRGGAVSRGSSRRMRKSSASNGSNSDSSLQLRRVSRGGTGNNSNNRSAKRDVVASASEESGGQRDQEQTRGSLSSSSGVASVTERAASAVTVPDVGHSDQREENASSSEGIVAEEVEVPDACVDTGLVGNGRQQLDDAAHQKQPGENSSTEAVTNSDGTQDDGTGTPQAAETNQQDDVSVAEGAMPNDSTASSADEAKALLIALPLQDTPATSKTADSQHDENGSIVPPSESEDESDQAPLRQQEARQHEKERAQEQEGDQQSADSIVETNTTGLTLPTVSEKREAAKERDESSSSAEDGQEAGIIDEKEEPSVVSMPDQTTDGVEVGGIGPEPEEFAPTERSLVAYCEVKRKPRGEVIDVFISFATCVWEKPVEYLQPQHVMFYR